MRYYTSITIAMAFGAANASPIGTLVHTIMPAIPSRASSFFNQTPITAVFPTDPTSSTTAIWLPIQTGYLRPNTTVSPDVEEPTSSEEDAEVTLISVTATPSPTVSSTTVSSDIQEKVESTASVEPAKPSTPSIRPGSWKNDLNLTHHGWGGNYTVFKNSTMGSIGPVIPSEDAFKDKKPEEVIRGEPTEEEVRRIEEFLAEDADESEVLEEHMLAAERAIETVSRDYQHLREMVRDN